MSQKEYFIILESASVRVSIASLHTDVNVGKKIESGDESKQGKEVRSSIQVKAADLQKKSPKSVIYFRLG